MSRQSVHDADKPRLEQRYFKEIRAHIRQELQLDNDMAIPRLAKIIVNVGVKRSEGDTKTFQKIEQVIGMIVGQAPVRTLARKSIASFKLREGMPVGVCVTLRRRNMYEFLDKLISLSLPKVRDFQGVPDKFDGRGNYTMGVKEWSIFPEADDLPTESGSFGMSITLHTTAQDDKGGRMLLQQFGMPFKR
jgi:large subunit ribosomal protein L5